MVQPLGTMAAIIREWSPQYWDVWLWPSVIDLAVTRSTAMRVQRGVSQSQERLALGIPLLLQWLVEPIIDASFGSLDWCLSAIRGMAASGHLREELVEQRAVLTSLGAHEVAGELSRPDPWVGTASHLDNLVPLFLVEACWWGT